MLWLPEVREAVCMTADTPQGQKWWVGALDRQHKLITAWSQRPESPSVLAQLKFVGTFNTLEDKVSEKKAKGYVEQAAVLQRIGVKEWMDLSSTSTTVPQLPPDVPTLHDDILADEMIGSVKLVGKVNSPTEIVSMELCRHDRHGNAVRLDHYEHDRREVPSFPLWQTVYESTDAALEAIDTIIESRVKKQYVVEEKDLKRATATHLLPAITLTLSGAQMLAWDF